MNMMVNCQATQVDFLADYFHNIQNYPVCSQVEPGYLKKLLPDSAPNQPEPIEKILEDVKRDIFPGLTHWQSPNFFAYFPCISSSAGIVGEMLTVGLNVVGFSWIASPAATELENIVMDWLGKLINLPNTYFFSGGGGGVIQRSNVGKIGKENIGKLVVYSSDQTHSSFQKSIKISGIRPENFRTIRLLTIQKDIKGGLVPLFLCATIGTTLITTVDPLHPLCEIAKEYGIWVVDYKNWQITLSWRFRALKLWFVLRCHGVVNLKKFIRNHIKMAKHFEGLISMDERFEIVVPRIFSMVCFRVSPLTLQKRFEFVDEVRVNEFNEKLLESINSSGIIHMTRTVVAGIYMIRFAIGALLTD
ncbi:hypothetical protein R3W88_007825 [Solanum pinnatisectum]|uniref:Uncharacterized protein n=1 Tax=Solanum pinnatisectum TaxID=50273 RepID=A0AAV9M9H5_9SOLN|nr:hypothetical protein R3W88_007825 [Solanum pinnatisectum]